MNSRMFRSVREHVVLPAIFSLFLMTTSGVPAAAGQVAPPYHDSNAPSLMPAAGLVTGPWYFDRLDRTTTDYGANRGKYVSIALRYKETFISYYDATDSSLRAAYRYEPNPAIGNCGPGNKWWCDVVDNNGDVGQWSSIAAAPYNVNAKFGIAYYDATNHALKFARYNCPSVPCSVTPETVFTMYGGSAGMYASAKYDYTGVVHIAFQVIDGGNSLLYYAHSVPSGGNCGSGKWQCVSIDSGLGIGEYASLDLNGDNEPRIAYYDAINKRLKYAAYLGSNTGNCGPGLTWQCDTIDDVDDVGRFVSLHQSSGEYPSIAYYDATKGKLKFAERAELPGNCGPLLMSNHTWQCDMIADMGIGITQPNQSAGISVEVVPGAGPVIAYMDASQGEGPSALTVARARRTETGAPHNCGPNNPGRFVWWCEALDGGGSWTSEASYVAMAADYKGWLSIAYYEEDDYYTTGYLKLAHQGMQLNLPLLKK